MRILIDLSFIKTYELTKSISLYGFRILQGMQELNITEDVSLLVDGDMDIYFRENYPQFKTIPISIKPFLRKMNWHFKNWLFDLMYRWKIMHTAFDVILTICNPESRATFRTKKKKISVIHDLKALSTTDPNPYKIWRFYDKLIKSADVVVAISEYTKQDVLSHFDVSSDKIKVIYNSIKMTMEARHPQSVIDGMKYILYVNTLYEYKNPLTLLVAFNSIKNHINENLVIVGQSTDYWHDVLLPYIKHNDLDSRVIRLQNVTDEELRYLYEHATMFVSCSQHEGFGYTPIEAAMYYCPVICTKFEALPETTMNLLNYYAPFDDSKELANKMIEVSNTPRKNTGAPCFSSSPIALSR